jgi:long-chain fatty acid transport protein
VRDEFVSPDLPDGSRLGLTAGLSYKITARLEADAAYMFEKVSERRTKADILRTDISTISGTYRTLVNGLGIGLSYKF